MGRQDWGVSTVSRLPFMFADGRVSSRAASPECNLTHAHTIMKKMASRGVDRGVFRGGAVRGAPPPGLNPEYAPASRLFVLSVFCLFWIPNTSDSKRQKL